MKKMLFIFFLTLCLMFTGCDNGKSDSVYGSVDDNGYEHEGSSEVSDKDSDRNERPDEAPRPGGGSSNGNGAPNGSTGDNANDSGNTADDKENFDDTDETDDSDSMNDEDPEKNEIYDVKPEIGSCKYGVPTAGEKQKVLERINYIRSLHNLKPVEYDESSDEMTAECSLVIAANEQLSHTPDSSWECWSQTAYDGCESSNLNLMMTTGYDTTLLDSADIVDGFMTEENEVPPITLGHRRWLIDPWLNSIAFGRADHSYNNNFVLGSAIKVINRNDPNDQQDISDTDIEFVAYPFENYPAALYNDNVMMSFTLIKDKFSKYSNGTGINFAAATIAIIDPSNKAMKVKNIEFDTEGYGVPNNLRWYAEGIKPNVKYSVTVSNIMVNNNPEFYQYWFELK